MLDEVQYEKLRLFNVFSEISAIMAFKILVEGDDLCRY